MGSSEQGRARYKDPRLSVASRVEDLITRMSLAQKVAQLNCFWLLFVPDESRTTLLRNGIGHISLVVSGESIDENACLVEEVQRFLVEQTDLGIPALVHAEALSGAMLAGATNFPGAIALGATWDPDGIEAMGRVIAKQLAALGIRHAFSPVLDVARDPRWGRVGETYGEDPTLTARLGVAFVAGVQGANLVNGVAATGKHFLGYAMTEGGLNMAAEHIGPRELREVYAKPFAAAIREAGLASIMNSYSTLDGVPIVASPEILTDLLRGELGFTGLTISDYGAIDKLVFPLKVAVDHTEAGIQALQAGMDVEAPDIKAYGAGLVEAVEAGRVPVELIDRAVRRVLELKFRLGLFEHRYPDREAIARVFAQPQDEELSYRLAQESIVLLQNRENLLPLSPALRTVAVIGANAALLRNLFGGYSYPAAVELKRGIGTGQQGVEVDAEALSVPTIDPKDATSLEPMFAAMYPRAATVLDAIAAKLPEATVSYAQGCSVKGSDRSGFDDAVRQAAQAELVILVVGGKDGWGHETCTTGEGLDASEITLPGVQEDLVRAVVATGRPLVLVHISARPLSSPWIAEQIPAIVQAWHAGHQGGRAIADVLFGDYNPGGKLPMTAARTTGQIPVYAAHLRGSGYEGREFSPWSPTEYVDGTGWPLYPFAHGLSYTQFTYADLVIEQSEEPGEGAVEISCVVSNTGERTGDEVVQLYIADRLASVARPVKELAGFRRVTLAVGQSRRVRFTVQLSQLALLDRTMRWVVEPGEMDVLIGSSSEDIRLQGSFRIGGETREVGAERSMYAASSDSVLQGYVPPLHAAGAGATARSAFSLDTTIGDLLANEAAREVLERHIPGLSADPRVGMIKSMTMQQLGAMALAGIQPEQLHAIAAELDAIKP